MCRALAQVLAPPPSILGLLPPPSLLRMLVSLALGSIFPVNCEIKAVRIKQSSVLFNLPSNVVLKDWIFTATHLVVPPISPKELSQLTRSPGALSSFPLWVL
ncbi:hypothetical protein L3X38_019342 [Prunus dulcis]|uniref:Uncharacterized protein n=1 Tax=Prunus dulcis TaxID=3755 RepID=A0AAD4WAU8_PRUDU|nr:hypothetical protein L3X38_019342 [Prunus dulcis]